MLPVLATRIATCTLYIQSLITVDITLAWCCRVLFSLLVCSLLCPSCWAAIVSFRDSWRNTSRSSWHRTTMLTPVYACSKIENAKQIIIIHTTSSGYITELTLKPFAAMLCSYNQLTLSFFCSGRMELSISHMFYTSYLALLVCIAASPASIAKLEEGLRMRLILYKSYITDRPWFCFWPYLVHKLYRKPSCSVYTQQLQHNKI